MLASPRRLVEHALSLQPTAKWLFFSILVGLVAGVGAIAFQVAGQAVAHLGLERFAGFKPEEAAGERRTFPEPSVATSFSPIRLILVLAVGGLASGAIVYTFAPEAEGHGTDAAIDAYHHKRGYIRPLVPIVKLVASAITIGTGGSGGREGPIAQIGAGFGSFLGTRLKVSARDRRVLLAAGMGAGVGAIFRAPLAGALFAAEILYRESDLESEVLVPAAVSSIVAFSVFSYWLPPEVRFVPLFGGGLRHRVDSMAELMPMSILAVALVAVGVAYIKTFYGVHALFKRLRIKRHFVPMIGAVLAGLLGLGLYELSHRDARSLAVLATGYGTLQQALERPQDLGIWLLMSVALVKILTTSSTIGSGGSGGVFGPSMVIGGCTGAAVGVLLHDLWPKLVPNPAVYTILGMAGFFAGCAHAPISTIVMVSEMTGDYNLLAPTMWVSTLCFLLCRPWTLYDKQLPTRLDSPAHRGDFLVDVLEGLAVRDVPWKERRTIPEDTSLREILQMLPNTRQHYFPVVDRQDQFVGIFSTDDVRRYLYDETIWEVANARDAMTSRVLSVRPDDDLGTALRKFTERNLDELPILDAERPTRLLGMLRRKDVIARYNRAIAEHQLKVREHQ